jgi:hypothetical protein
MFALLFLLDKLAVPNCWSSNDEFAIIYTVVVISRCYIETDTGTVNHIYHLKHAVVRCAGIEIIWLQLLDVIYLPHPGNEKHTLQGLLDKIPAALFKTVLTALFASPAVSVTKEGIALTELARTPPEVPLFTEVNALSASVTI